MSSTLESRNRAALRAVLAQQRPRELIRAAERFDGSIEDDAYAPTVHVNELLIPDVETFTGGSTIGAPATAPTTAVVLVATIGGASPDCDPSIVFAHYRSQLNSWARWTDKAKEALRQGALVDHRSSTAAARLRVDRLTSLQAAFSFTVQDLAAVLGITRTQMYKWLDAAAEIKLQESSRARLGMAERMAKEWTARSTMPLSSLSKEPLGSGGTILTLLTADIVDEGSVLSAFEELREKMQGKPKTRGQRLREAGFTRRPSARSLPSDE